MIKLIIYFVSLLSIFLFPCTFLFLTSKLIPSEVSNTLLSLSVGVKIILSSSKSFKLFLLQHLYNKPAQIAPAIGASQNNHNCFKASPPTIKAGPVLRAGLTEVLVIGIEIK